MDRGARARAAWVTMLSMLMVVVLCVVAIFRFDAPAVALRAALACLIFHHVVYLTFEAKVARLLLHPAPGQLGENSYWYYAPEQPPSFSRTFSSPGSSVERGLSLESSSGRRTPPSDSGYMAESSSPFSGRGSSSHRPSARLRSSLRSLGNLAPPPSPASRSSSDASVLTRVERVEAWADATYAAARSPSSRSRSGGRSRRGYPARQADRRSHGGAAGLKDAIFKR